jgi:hypothetical protein
MSGRRPESDADVIKRLEAKPAGQLSISDVRELAGARARVNERLDEIGRDIERRRPR